MFYELTNKLIHQNHCLFIVVNSYETLGHDQGKNKHESQLCCLGSTTLSVQLV